ncbi:hypothetical protein ISCGN_004468 [Ixodes scapularis]
MVPVARARDALRLERHRGTRGTAAPRHLLCFVMASSRQDPGYEARIASLMNLCVVRCVTNTRTITWRRLTTFAAACEQYLRSVKKKKRKAVRELLKPRKMLDEYATIVRLQSYSVVRQMFEEPDGRELFECFRMSRARSKAWLQYANRDDLLGKQATELFMKYRICSDHFLARDFMDPAKTRLTRTAVPSVHPEARRETGTVQDLAVSIVGMRDRSQWAQWGCRRATAPVVEVELKRRTRGCGRGLGTHRTAGMANFLELLMQVVPILGTAKPNAPLFVPGDNAGHDHVIITNWDWLDFRQGTSTSPAALLEKERPDPTNVRGLGTHRTAGMANFLQLLMQEEGHDGSTCPVMRIDEEDSSAITLVSEDHFFESHQALRPGVEIEEMAGKADAQSIEVGWQGGAAIAVGSAAIARASTVCAFQRGDVIATADALVIEPDFWDV